MKSVQKDITHSDGSREILKTGGRQRISPVVIYRKCTQRTSYARSIREKAIY